MVKRTCRRAETFDAFLVDVNLFVCSADVTKIRLKKVSRFQLQVE